LKKFKKLISPDSQEVDLLKQAALRRERLKIYCDSCRLIAGGTPDILSILLTIKHGALIARRSFSEKSDFRRVDECGSGNAQANNYWSSTEYNSNNAWNVNFNNGNVNNDNKNNNNNYVRCVRGELVFNPLR